MAADMMTDLRSLHPSPISDANTGSQQLLFTLFNSLLCLAFKGGFPDLLFVFQAVLYLCFLSGEPGTLS